MRATGGYAPPFPAAESSLVAQRLPIPPAPGVIVEILADLPE